MCIRDSSLTCDYSLDCNRVLFTVCIIKAMDSRRQTTTASINSLLASLVFSQKKYERFTYESITSRLKWCKPSIRLGANKFVHSVVWTLLILLNLHKICQFCLALDEHTSHRRNVYIINMVRANYVKIIFLPPYTTHKLQEIDKAFI